MTPMLYARKRGKPVSLTALIDVVFILLMFFMLTSSFSRNTSIDFQSPIASTQSSEVKPQILKLYKDGAISLYAENQPLLHDDEIRAHINTRKPTVILPAADVDVQSIIFALEKLSGFGIEQLSLGNSLPLLNKNERGSLQK